jgi:hypothetical protein
MASNKMMLMIPGKLNGQGAMPLAQISSSLKRNDRNTLRDLDEYGRTKPGGAGQGGHQNITRQEYGGLAHNGIGGAFSQGI